MKRAGYEALYCSRSRRCQGRFGEVTVDSHVVCACVSRAVGREHCTAALQQVAESSACCLSPELQARRPA